LRESKKIDEKGVVKGRFQDCVDQAWATKRVGKGGKVREGKPLSQAAPWRLQKRKREKTQKGQGRRNKNEE